MGKRTKKATQAEHRAEDAQPALIPMSEEETRHAGQKQHMGFAYVATSEA